MSPSVLAARTGSDGDLDNITLLLYTISVNLSRRTYETKQDPAVEKVLPVRVAGV